MTWDVLVTCPSMVAVLDEHRDQMRTLDMNVSAIETAQQLNAHELLQLIADFDGVIAGDDEFNKQVLIAGADGKLKAIAKWGVGMDNIDLETAQSLRLAVSNTPGHLAAEVADVAIGYVILLARQLHVIDQAVRRGHWFKPMGQSLSGKTLGLVGAGSVGSAVAVRALAHEMSVDVYDPLTAALERATALGAHPKSLDDVLASSDFVVLACALTQDNSRMIDQRRLSLMKPTAALVNVSRGGLVDERALIMALESGGLDGAALDVYENEPVQTDSPLIGMNHVILGTHNASNTREAVRTVSIQAIRNLAADLALQRA